METPICFQMACFQPPPTGNPHGSFLPTAKPVAIAIASTEDLATEIQAPRMSVASVAENVERFVVFCVFCLVF